MHNNLGRNPHAFNAQQHHQQEDQDADSKFPAYLLGMAVGYVDALFLQTADLTSSLPLILITTGSLLAMLNESKAFTAGFSIMLLVMLPGIFKSFSQADNLPPTQSM